MIELIHALITSLLLSTAAGFGVDASTSTDDEPTNSETGIEVGKLPSRLVSPRSQAPTKSDAGDEYQPTALAEQVAFCEPSVDREISLGRTACHPLAVAFATAGRSP